MPLLTKTTAKQHCRTCLVKINVEENQLVTEIDSYGGELKDIFIEIAGNCGLHAFFQKYIIDEKIKAHIKEFPEYVCLTCFNSIQQADSFLSQARVNSEILYNLLVNENSHGNNDIYDLLLKDNLMETETVIFPEESAPDTIDVQDLDPFNASPNFFQSDPETSDNEEWTANVSITNQEDINKRRRVTRSNRKKLDNIAEENPKAVKEKLQNMTEKKKRRTKKEMKEMEDLLIDQLKSNEDNKKKLKRRQKGTKNSFKCSKCSHTFAHKLTFDAHVRKIHEGRSRPYHCDRCDKAYAFIGGLYTHIKEIHEHEDRVHICDFPNCGRTYSSLVAMQKHKRMKHTDKNGGKMEQNKYVCEQCGVAFSQATSLRYHRLTRHPTDEEKLKKKDTKLYECDVCKKNFHTRYTLKYHKMQLHFESEMNYTCNICGVKKAKKFMLAQHMLVHSTNKMQCEHCEKQFIRKFELKAHIKAVHMKLKPFECKYCIESFASRKTLRHHEYIHTGEKPYVCNICGQAYRQPTCLKNHRKTHEKNAASINQDLANTLSSNKMHNSLVNTTDNSTKTNVT